MSGGFDQGKEKEGVGTVSNKREKKANQNKSNQTIYIENLFTDTLPICTQHNR